MSGESIYALIPQPISVSSKPPLYKSKHSGETPPTYSTFGMTGTSKPGFNNVSGEGAAIGGHHTYRKPFATMGKEGNAPHPSDITKRRTGGGGGAYDAALESSLQSERHSIHRSCTMFIPSAVCRCPISFTLEQLNAVVSSMLAYCLCTHTFTSERLPNANPPLTRAARLCTCSWSIPIHGPPHASAPQQGRAG